MLDDAFADFEGEIEAGKLGIALLELFDDVQRMQVVIEASAVDAHEFVEFALAGVAKGWVADVVDKGKRFRELYIDAERGGNGARDLRDLERMREAIAKVIRVASGEGLGLGFEPAKAARIHDAVAVPRKFAPVGVRLFRKAPAAPCLRAHGPGRLGFKEFDKP